MADLTAISTWTLADVQHFGRRAGFGLNPAEAATLQAQVPSVAIDAWVDGTGAAYDATAFTAALATADVVAEPLVSANTTVAGSVAVPAVAAPHPFLVQGADAWRNNLRQGDDHIERCNLHQRTNIGATEHQRCLTGTHLHAFGRYFATEQLDPNWVKGLWPEPDSTDCKRNNRSEKNGQPVEVFEKDVHAKMLKHLRAKLC